MEPKKNPQPISPVTDNKQDRVNHPHDPIPPAYGSAPAANDPHNPNDPDFQKDQPYANDPHNPNDPDFGKEQPYA